MADAPGGGGSEWGVWEIVLVLLLGIGFLSQLNGDPVIKPDTTATQKTAISAPSTKTLCGLSIARPHSLETIDQFITIAGSVGSCDWIPSNGIGLYVQVIDSKGMPVSAYTAVPIEIADVTGVIPFSASIPLTSTPSTTRGYVIMVPATTATSTPVTARIPIQFKRY